GGGSYASVAHGAGDRCDPLLQGKGGGADRYRVHRFTASGSDGMVDGHTGGGIGGDGRTHGGRGRVRSHTSGKGPDKVSGQRIAGEVLRSGREGGSVGGRGPQIARRGEGGRPARVAHADGDGRDALLQGKA